MTFAAAMPVTLITRTVSGQDAYGNDTFTETQTTINAAFAPGTSLELVQGQDLVTIQPTLYLPPDVDPNPIDAVLVDGQRYDVDGDTDVWMSPFTGWHPGNVVKLKRVTG